MQCSGFGTNPTFMNNLSTKAICCRVWKIQLFLVSPKAVSKHTEHTDGMCNRGVCPSLICHYSRITYSIMREENVGTSFLLWLLALIGALTNSSLILSSSRSCSTCATAISSCASCSFLSLNTFALLSRSSLRFSIASLFYLGHQLYMFLVFILSRNACSSSSNLASGSVHWNVVFLSLAGRC